MFDEMHAFQAQVCRNLIGTSTFSPTTHPTTHQHQATLQFTCIAVYISNFYAPACIPVPLRWQLLHLQAWCAWACLATQTCFGDPNGSTFIPGIYMPHFALGCAWRPKHALASLTVQPSFLEFACLLWRLGVLGDPNMLWPT